MTDSGDDWENQLDSDYEEREAEKKKEEEAKASSAFKDEDTVDTEKLKKEKEDAKKKAEEERQANARTKESKKVDYDKKFAERQAALSGVSKVDASKAGNTAGLSKQAAGMELEKQAEAGLADQLFGGPEESTPTTFGSDIKLNSEKEYKQFGKQISGILYQGSAPYRIENFFKELCKDLPEHCDSKQMQKIIDSLSMMQKEKAKKEKEERDGKAGKKKKNTAALKGGGGKGYEVNCNPAMVNDVMGVNQDDEYGDYGAETGGETFKRAEENDYDFI